MQKIKPSIFSTLLLTSILSSVSFAAVNADVAIANSKALGSQPVKPSVTFWGLGGNQIIGRGQGLIPFAGDGFTSIFYGAVEGAGSFKKSNGYSAGVAAGYRKIINDSYILGGYVFADYNRSPSSHSFWVANPGFEALGDVWDFRVNGYIPTTCRHWLGGEELAENIGKTQFEKAFGHNRFDHLFQWYEEVGPGFDAEVGRRIPIPLAKTHSLRMYVGGYHYSMDKTDNITGVEGRVVYPVSKYISLEARDSYDKVRKNVFMGGIRITFGGSNNEDKDNLGVAGRLADPIEHNFGNFASANSVAVGKDYIDENIEYHLPGNFWYFDNAAKNSTGDGTFEHPFNAIDLRAYQIMTNSGALSQNVQMYVATGISPYDLSGMPDRRLPLPYGDSIFGRTDNFKLAAKGSQRPELDGGMTAFGGNNINDIQLISKNQNFGGRGALFIFGPQFINAVNINDVNLNVSENLTEAAGISVMNSYLTINNSQINVSSKEKSKQNFGIDLVNNSALFVGDNNVIHSNVASNLPFETDSAAIAGNGPVIIYGNNNQVVAEAIGTESRSIGIFVFNNVIDISGSNNHIAANSAGFDSRAGGIVNIGTTIISGNNNKISGNVAGAEGDALGIANIDFTDFDTKKLNNGNGQIIISGNNNQITANSAEQNSVGILNAGGMLMISGYHNQIIANSVLHVAHHECNAGGIVNFGDATTTISGFNNQIIVSSPFKAYGIFIVDPTSMAALNIKHTVFNVASTAADGIAAGINMDTQTDASKLRLQYNIFNVSAAGVGSKAYGVYLPNATTPAPNGNIAANIFNVTNSSAPLNAWGVFANSSWGSSAAWIRAHNIWLHPTAATPQQQVFTNGAGFAY